MQILLVYPVTASSGSQLTVRRWTSTPHVVGRKKPYPALAEGRSLVQGTCAKKSQGDADCDGLIDQADYIALMREYIGVVSTTQADFTNDTAVNLQDFETWRRNTSL